METAMKSEYFESLVGEERSRVFNAIVIGNLIIKYKRLWTKNGKAKDKYGNSVDVMSDYAVRFCAFGALIKANESYNDGRNALWCLNDISYKVYGLSLISTNDKHGYNAVKKVYGYFIDEYLS